MARRARRAAGASRHDAKRATADGGGRPSRPPCGSKIFGGWIFGGGVLALALAACGSSPERRPSPIVPSRRAPLEAGPIQAGPRAAPARPEPCRIEAPRAEALRVSPAEGEAFAVAVADGAVTFTPTEAPDALDVRVETPLAFAAAASPEDQRLELAVGGARAAGAVETVEGLRVRLLRQEGDALQAEVQLGRRVPGARRGLELSVGPVPVECAALRVAPGTNAEVTPAILAPVTGLLRVARVLPLVVRPVRIAPTELTLRPVERGAALPVWVTGRSRDWARVTVAFTDGTRVSGWTPDARLRPPTTEERERAERLMDAGPSAPVDLGALDGLGPAPPPAAAEDDVYVGPATLAPESEVHAAADGPVWARSAERPLEVHVRWRRGAERAELLHVPGMVIPARRAWVSADALRLP
jgi:hypothetical protein